MVQALVWIMKSLDSTNLQCQVTLNQTRQLVTSEYHVVISPHPVTRLTGQDGKQNDTANPATSARKPSRQSRVAVKPALGSPLPVGTLPPALKESSVPCCLSAFNFSMSFLNSAIASISVAQRAACTSSWDGEGEGDICRGTVRPADKADGVQSHLLEDG
ncbi:hypothetical protein E2C01_047182 [Portunus trituberculatus]|uniref:Uncharacterized protein n=1 Tax=Portunus trituberculatus TaxID=210409 RepID=A0A5B7G7U5_PORTR|nr:hypothetical protein [Portunus trituberculatus]